jgi:hypothetical protein
MSASMNLKIRLGPLVTLEVSGENCEEIHSALEGFEKLNKQLDAMCGDLANRIYPEEEPHQQHSA